MIEHLMSALAGLEITDAEVQVDGDELPILDGSSADYVNGLKAAGLQTIGSEKRCRLFGRINLREQNQAIGVSVGTGRWRYEFEREDFFPGYQVFEAYLEGAVYEDRVSPARTFAFEDEIEQLLMAGLGKGGSEENTLVIGKDGYRTPSRFADEPARHKLLDCIGDLALAGIPIRFLNVVAERTGHRMHVQAAQRLTEICEWED
jgi:UDP-3-O-acyl-N-acetylglucosamine deacetylase